MLVLADAFGQLFQQSRVSGRDGSTVSEQNPSHANGEMQSLETHRRDINGKMRCMDEQCFSSYCDALSFLFRFDAARSKWTSFP